MAWKTSDLAVAPAQTFENANRLARKLGHQTLECETGMLDEILELYPRTVWVQGLRLHTGCVRKTINIYCQCKSIFFWYFKIM